MLLRLNNGIPGAWRSPLSTPCYQTKTLGADSSAWITDISLLTGSPATTVHVWRVPAQGWESSQSPRSLCQAFVMNKNFICLLRCLKEYTYHRGKTASVFYHCILITEADFIFQPEKQILANYFVQSEDGWNGNNTQESAEVADKGSTWGLGQHCWINF